MALLSVNLGLITFPIPVLDGGLFWFMQSRPCAETAGEAVMKYSFRFGLALVLTLPSLQTGTISFTLGFVDSCGATFRRAAAGFGWR